MDEAEVDNSIGRRRSGLESFEVTERATLNLGTSSYEFGGRLFRTGEAYNLD